MKKPYASPELELKYNDEPKRSGNLRLPYGLCKKYGIELPDGATPREAWEALKGKTGITPEKAYNDLKKENKATTARDVNFEKNKEEEPKREENNRIFVSERKGVSESLAQRAKESRSMQTYHKGSETAIYNARIDEFDKNVNKLIEKYGKTNKTLTEEDWDKVHDIASRYASNLEKYTDEVNKNEASYPAWFVAGPAKYNTRKNEALIRRTHQLYTDNENKINPDRNIYLKKIREILTNSNIKADDSNAVGKLQDKYDKLKAELENGKALNAYFRKHGTLKGADGISDKEAETFDKNHREDPYFNSRPFPSYRMANLNAEMRRIQGRIDHINREKAGQEQAKNNPEAVQSRYPKVDGVEVNENADIMRIQLKFNGKPPETVRSKLKNWGFRWSPRENAWQRQLTNNGRNAAKQVLKEIGNSGK